ncbi:hypothetical protein VTG60DRAFT_2145 [Thermothelomyces hinnuleus]
MTPEEDALVTDIVRPCYASLALANDYFSFDREWEETRSKQNNSKPINAVWLYMQWRGVDVATAKRLVVGAANRYERLDDIEDGSELRRCYPAARSVFGVPQTINSACFAIVEAIQKTYELSDVVPSAPEIAFEQLRDLCISGKATTFTGLATCRYASQKGFCEDLNEGKLSYPLVHYFTTSSWTKTLQVREMLEQRREAGAGGGLGEPHKKLVLQRLRESGSMAHT